MIIFGPGVTSGSSPVDIDTLAQYEKSTVTNLGFRVDEDFRLDSQISAVVKSNFYQLRQLKAHFRTLIHAFITSQLNYCNSLYAGFYQSFSWCKMPLHSF